MIQRIQSLWLFLAFVSITIIMFFPIFTIHSTGANSEIYSFYFTGFFNNVNHKLLHSTYAFASVLSITSLLSLVNIFLFKSRKIQMRLCIYNSILIIALVGLMVYFAYFSLDKAVWNFNFPMVLPIVALIFTIMARSGIKKDENLIRSVDRIR